MTFCLVDYFCLGRARMYLTRVVREVPPCVLESTWSTRPSSPRPLDPAGCAGSVRGSPEVSRPTWAVRTRYSRITSIRSVNFSIVTPSLAPAAVSSRKASPHASSAAATKSACASAPRPALSATWMTAAVTPAVKRASRSSFSSMRPISRATAVHHADVASLAAVRAVVKPVLAQPDAVLALAHPAVAVTGTLRLGVIALSTEDLLGHCRLCAEYKRVDQRDQAAS